MKNLLLTFALLGSIASASAAETVTLANLPPVIIKGAHAAKVKPAAKIALTFSDLQRARRESLLFGMAYTRAHTNMFGAFSETYARTH